MNFIYILFIVYYSVGLLKYLYIVGSNKKKVGSNSYSLVDTSSSDNSNNKNYESSLNSNEIFNTNF